MRRDQRRGVVVPDKTEDTEAKRSIISSEVISLNEPLWLMAFHSSMPKQSNSTFSVSTDAISIAWRTTRNCVQVGRSQTHLASRVEACLCHVAIQPGCGPRIPFKATWTR